jgi:hypothetical protein
MAKRVTYSCATIYGAALGSKAPPVEWLTRFLATGGVGPTVDFKYVQVNLGAELRRCQELFYLFTQAGSAVEPTAPYSFHQNGPRRAPP